MSRSRPDDEMPIELLAAYVDGELDVAACARVEACIAEHPEAYADLLEQRALSPQNEELWDAVAPPMPCAEKWEITYSRIENRLIRPAMPARTRHRTARYLAPAIALAGLAVAVLVIVIGLGRDSFKVTSSHHPLAVAPSADDDDEGVFRIATADDVQLIQLPEEASDLIVVGRHPVLDTPLLLASTSDVDIHNLGPDDQGRMPFVEMIAGPNIPMVVAQTVRR